MHKTFLSSSAPRSAEDMGGLHANGGGSRSSSGGSAGATGGTTTSGVGSSAGSNKGRMGFRRTRRRSSHRRARGDVVTICISDCKYDCVKQAARSRGWRLVDGDGVDARKSNIFWVDTSCIGERMRELAPWQRINHFPGMNSIARKGRMAQALDRMRRKFPADYSFYPRTWVLPAEWSSFKSEFDAQGRSSRTFILKPDAGCQGKGIYLTQELERISPLESQVAQLYVRKPLLIDSLKFDLRVYVLITSIRPLRVYMFRDGLARFCTEEYSRPASENLSDRRMHLTNYAINKGSDNFVANEHQDDDHTGSKRSLRWLLEWVGKMHGEERAKSVWRRMGSAAMKTIVAVLPQLHRDYRHVFGEETFASHGPQAGLGPECGDAGSEASWGESPRGGTVEDGDKYEHREEPIEGSRCIEILGFDFMIDSSLKPWLIEVNHLPSFATDSPLDANIKSRVVASALATVRAKATDRASYASATRRGCQARLYSNPQTAAGAVSPSPASGSEKSTASPAARNPHVAQLRQQVENIYSRQAPDKMSKVDALFRKYSGQEQKLLLLVQQKYTRSNSAILGDGEEGGSEGDAGAPKVDAMTHVSDASSSSSGQSHCGENNSEDAQSESGSAESHSYLRENAPSSAASTPRASTCELDGDGHISAPFSATPPHKERAPSSGSLPRNGSSKIVVKTESPPAAERNVWEEEEDPEVMGWEMSQLDGWDRLWPTLGGADSVGEGGDVDGDTEAENLSIPLPLHMRTCERIQDIIRYAFEEDQKQFLRLKAPLHQQRGEFDLRLPFLSAAGRGESGVGPGAYSSPDLWMRIRGGGGLVMGKAPLRIEKPPLPVPGPVQQAVADRLSKGYSSKKWQRGGAADSSAEPERPLAVAVQAAASRAREWQQRLENARLKRASATQSVKINTLYFDLSPLSEDLS